MNGAAILAGVFGATAVVAVRMLNQWHKQHRAEMTQRERDEADQHAEDEKRLW